MRFDLKSTSYAVTGRHSCAPWAHATSMEDEDNSVIRLNVGGHQWLDQMLAQKSEFGSANGGNPTGSRSFLFFLLN